MTTEELASLVQSRGYEVKIKKHEIFVKDCWFCGNEKWNLQLNATKGVYGCWACKNKGRLQDLLADNFNVEVRIPVRLDGKQKAQNFREQPNIKTLPAVEVVSAKQYLNARGLSDLDIKRYELSVCIEKGNTFYGRILIPVREFWTQTAVGFVARGYMGERPKYLANIEPTCIGGYKQTNRNGTHVLVEGALDAINVHRAGFNVGALMGKGHGDLLEQWVSRVPETAAIAILLDGDAQADTRSFFWRAKAIRDNVVVVPLPPSFDPGKLLPSVLRSAVQNAIEQNLHFIAPR